MEVEFRVNGVSHELDVAARTTLADALRDGLGLTGTRLAASTASAGPARSC